MSEWTASLEQDGIIVAEVSAPTEEECWREIQHYAALMYAQDGPVILRAPTETTK